MAWPSMVALLLMVEFMCGVGSEVTPFRLISTISTILERTSPIALRLVKTLIHIDIVAVDLGLISAHFIIL